MKIQFQILESIIATFFSLDCLVLIGSVVRDYYASPTSKMKSPTEITVVVEDPQTFLQKLNKTPDLEVCLDSKSRLIVRHCCNDLYFTINIVEYNPDWTETDFDVNLLLMPNTNTIQIDPKAPYKLADIIESISKREFKIIKKNKLLDHPNPDCPPEDLLDYYNSLLQFVTIQANYITLLTSGWTCKQDINKYFIPSLIQKADSKTTCSNCQHTCKYISNHTIILKSDTSKLCFDCLSDHIKNTISPPN